MARKKTSKAAQGTQTKSEYRRLAPDEIITTGTNPRVIRPESQKFQELLDSVRNSGVLMPIHVRAMIDREQGGRFELLAGERRLAAALMAKREDLPAMVHKNLTDEQAFEITFAENYAREDLTPLEEGRAAAMLLERLDGDARAAADKLGRTERWIRQRALIETGLIQEWKEEIGKDGSEFAAWSATHLGLIARFPASVQQDILSEFEGEYWEESISAARFTGLQTANLRVTSRWKAEACIAVVRESLSSGAHLLAIMASTGRAVA